jgi:hypothetical protein
MSKPQQPELHRSGLGETDPDARKAHLTAESVPDQKGRKGNVPEGSRPGHHPEEEQDKPHVKLSANFANGEPSPSKESK